MNVAFYVNPDPSMLNPPQVPEQEIQVFEQTLAEKIIEALEIIQARGV